MRIRRTRKHTEYRYPAPMRVLLKQLWGSLAWIELDEWCSISVWKKWYMKTLRATLICAEENVVEFDTYWMKELNDIVNFGIERIKHSKSYSEMHDHFAFTYVKVSFHQFGLFPNHGRSGQKVTLNRRFWKINGYRTVKYFQDEKQKINLVKYKFSPQAENCLKSENISGVTLYMSKKGMQFIKQFQPIAGKTLLVNEINRTLGKGRDSEIIASVLNEGHEIVLYDPDALEIMKKLEPDFEMKFHKLHGAIGDELGKICLLSACAKTI